jgi:hypothetical protein
MAFVYRRSRAGGQGDEAREKQGRAKLTDFPWALILISAVPVCLLACYLTFIAPVRLRGLAGADVPFPAATEFLADVSRWCEGHPFEAWLIALGLLAGGFVLPVPTGKYYIALTIAAALTLGYSYYSLSAPVDRLLKGVQDSRLPERSSTDRLRPQPRR